MFRFLALLVVALAMPAVAGAAPIPVLSLDAHVGVTTSGGFVTSWADQSGAGHHATQGLGNAPLYVANGLNGHPTIRFNGSNQFLNVAGQVLTSQQFTILAVVRDTRAAGDGTFREVFSNWNGGSGNTFTSVFFGTTNASPVAVRFTDDYINVGPVANPATPFLLTGESTATNALVYQNFTLLGAKGLALSPRNLTTPYVIGQQGSLGGEFWQGDIAALVVYDQALTPAELLAAQTQLGSRFGLNGFPVPEPATLVVFAAVGVAAIARRRRVAPPVRELAV